MSESVIKLLLQAGIALLGKLIPALGSFLGGPLGFLAGWAISFLRGLLLDWVAQLERFGKVDGRYLEIRNRVQLSHDSYLQSIDKSLPIAEREKAYEEFSQSIRKIRYSPPAK